MNLVSAEDAVFPFSNPSGPESPYEPEVSVEISVVLSELFVSGNVTLIDLLTT